MDSNMETGFMDKEPDITIRDINSEDAEAVVNVFYKAWLDTYPNEKLGITKADIESKFKNSFDKDYIQKRGERYENLPDDTKMVVAVDGDKVVGTASMVRNPENNQLRTIYVLPEMQGRGVGRKLWNDLAGFRDPNKDTIVHVADYNENAITFYKKLGFVDSGKRWSDEKFKMTSGAMIPEMEMVIKRSNE